MLRRRNRPFYPRTARSNIARMASTCAVVGLDIGGANLKAAHSDGPAITSPFPLWKNPAGLSAALRQLLSAMPSADILAVTMTGELCDCFASKHAGVQAILAATKHVAGSLPVRVWRSDGRFSSTDAAGDDALLTASANWSALATFAGRFAPVGPAILIDIGSTTTDLIPLFGGRPVPTGRTDTERMHSGELVYTGIRRTPLCAILGRIVAAELFATTLDAWLLRGSIAEDASDCHTADGQPATRAAAHLRLARMLCGDLSTTTASERLHLAQVCELQQTNAVASALQGVVSSLAGPIQTIILAGEGEFLAKLAVERLGGMPTAARVSLADRLGPARSQAACAYAVAVLAAEEH